MKRARADLSEIDEMESLVLRWLGQEPDNDLGVFAAQVARAEWLEKRYFENIQQIIGGSV